MGREVTPARGWELLGESRLIHDLCRILEQCTQSLLINLYGEVGTGKTSILTKLGEVYPDSIRLDLSRGMSAETLSSDDKKLILVDDADTYFTNEQFKEFLWTVYSQCSSIVFVFTSKNKFFMETMPGIQNCNLELGNRQFTLADFASYLQENDRLGLAPDRLSERVLKSTYLFATYCRNFRLLEKVLVMLANKARGKKNSVTSHQFVEVITHPTIQSELNRDLVIDTRNVGDTGYLFVVRSKDKVEKLKDIIVKYYPNESLLNEIMRLQLHASHVDDIFQQDISYEEKIVNVCLVYDPVELMSKILGPRDVVNELNELEVAEATFSYSIEDRIKLVLKSIGWNILDDPKGIEYFRNRFQENICLLKEDQYKRMSKEYIIGLGMSCYQDMESILFELLNFYSVYLCGSMSAFLDEYNRAVGYSVNHRRITFGQYIGMFSFFNQLARDEKYELAMLNISRKEIVGSAIIKRLETLSSARTFFSHYQKIENSEVPFEAYYKRVASIYEQSIEICTMLSNSIFPEIIKIKQIIFDEFGRRLYVATDWKKSEIRFSLAGTLANVDIYSHYYLLRTSHSISINPIILPRYFDNTNQLFENSLAYQKSSQTQIAQGGTLLGYLKLSDDIKILDVGCGNGKTTIDLFKKNSTVTIDAFDVSEAMINTAIQSRIDAGITDKELHFFVQDALTLNIRDYYDMVFSNASLHWIYDSATMYKKLYECLKPEGQLAVHQGGYGTYRGLHRIVKQAIDELNYQMYYKNWIFPAFYPTKDQLEKTLRACGFVEVEVKSVETDGSEYENLVDNFANASLLPYLQKLPDEKMKEQLKKTYLRLCAGKNLDTYTHRLYAFAVKPLDQYPN